jgi:hypothetical protein
VLFSLLRLMRDDRGADHGRSAARELARWSVASIAGPLPRCVYARAAAAASGFASERLPLMTRPLRYRLFLASQAHAVSATRLKWVAEHIEAPAPDLPLAGRRSIEELPPSALVGAHGLELVDQRWFRWTHPVSVLRIAMPPGAARLVIDTGAVRGAPSSYLHAVFAGRRRIAPAQLDDDGERLRIDLSSKDADAAARCGGIMSVCAPLPLARDSPETRRLGMPVFSVELETAKTA